MARALSCMAAGRRVERIGVCWSDRLQDEKKLWLMGRREESRRLLYAWCGESVGSPYILAKHPF